MAEMLENARNLEHNLMQGKHAHIEEKEIWITAEKDTETNIESDNVYNFIIVPRDEETHIGSNQELEELRKIRIELHENLPKKIKNKIATVKLEGLGVGRQK